MTQIADTITATLGPHRRDSDPAMGVRAYLVEESEEMGFRYESCRQEEQHAQGRRERNCSGNHKLFTMGLGYKLLS